MTKSLAFSLLKMSYKGLMVDGAHLAYVTAIRSKENCSHLEESIKKQQLMCADLQNDLTSCREKEKELLDFSEKLTSLNAELQATKDNLSIQVCSLSASQYTSCCKLGSRKNIGK